MFIVFANKKGMIYLRCPFCNNNSMKPVTLFPIHQPVSMACSCGKTFEFQIEIRKGYRKKVTLKGCYIKGDFINDFQMITVTNLSQDGCCLLASDNHTLHVGDSIILDFRLDNLNKTRIKRSATVAWVNGNKIGCQLITAAYDPELGFYVQDFKISPS